MTRRRRKKKAQTPAALTMEYLTGLFSMANTSQPIREAVCSCCFLIEPQLKPCAAHLPALTPMPRHWPSATQPRFAKGHSKEPLPLLDNLHHHKGSGSQHSGKAGSWPKRIKA